ncbi:hypothetical protein [Streptomyces recifensis]|uniref:hypothetical protein n=1 Tax=Streptomyces recifensis TaxID=67355 RepID=UPI001ABF7A86|nr:hypothetical protein [Streptomyces recifensis]
MTINRPENLFEGMTPAQYQETLHDWTTTPGAPRTKASPPVSPRTSAMPSRFTPPPG